MGGRGAGDGAAEVIEPVVEQIAEIGNAPVRPAKRDRRDAAGAPRDHLVQMLAAQLAGLEHGLRVPNSQRIFYLKAAIEMDFSIQEITDLTGIDPWFLEHMRQIVEVEKELAGLMA